MKADRLKKEGARIIASLLLSLIGTSSEALCLKDCRGSGGPIQPRNKISFHDSHDSSRTSDSFNRMKSPDVSNSKNTIAGDLHFQVGHQNLKINNSGSSNSPINASVTSVINLGDVTTTGDTTYK